MKLRLVVPAGRAAGLVSLALAVTLAGPAPAADSKWDPARLVTPPLGRIPAVTPERWTLPNGMIVYLLENHDLPRVTGTLYAPSTPLWIPDDRVGLAGITGEVMRSGGTARHPGDGLDDRLGALGASVSCDIGADLAHGRFECLSENLDEVLGLFADVVQRPAFPDEKLELAKVGVRRAIASRNDDMIPLLVRVARQAVWGKGSVLARTPEYATVNEIRREDCVALHAKVFEPGRAVLAIYGDFQTAALKKQLSAGFGGWKGAGAPRPTAPALPPPTRARLVFAPKDDVTQTGMLVAEPGFLHKDPDDAAMDVFETALGGGFQSRLVNRIRTERGLAYATGAEAGGDFTTPGIFLAYSLTKSESTMVALSLLREEVRKAVQAPFTAEELRLAKSTVQNLLVFNFERPSEVLFRSAFYEVTGYPQDFLERYQKSLEAVDAQAVLDAARRKVHPDALVAVVVGKEKDFDRPLTSAGLTVERVDITIPAEHAAAPSAPAAPASPGAATRGRAWLDKAAELAGGSAAWQAVHTVVMDQSVDLTIRGQTLNVESAVSWTLPDRRRMEQRTPMGTMVQGFDGERGWSSRGGEVQDDPRGGESVRQSWERSILRLFARPGEVKVQALEAPHSVEGKSYRAAAVASDVVHDWTLLFDADGRLAGMEYQGDTPAGAAHVTDLFSDWRPVGKVQLPFGTRRLADGETFMNVKITSWKLNEALADTLYRKPR